MTSGAGTLLIVDDEDLNRLMLGRWLELEGFEVVAARSGQEALDLVAGKPFDLALLDVAMPGLDGLEVLDRLRIERSPTELPVIMVTGRYENESLLEAFGRGANDYVTKPINFPVALARIRTQLAQSRAHIALRESETRYALTARGANDGLWDWDLRTDEIDFSSRWKSMLGCQEGEIGTSPDEWLGRVHPEDLDRVRAALAAHRRDETPRYESEHRMRHKDGTYRWVLSRGVALRGPSGECTRMAGSQTDVTRSKSVDTLTGLPTRTLFLDRLESAIDQAHRDPSFQFAVLLLDLDRFNLINDSLGHLIGDQLLIQVGRRLEECLEAPEAIARTDGSSTVARFGGDEFIVLLRGIGHPDDASWMAGRIQAELARPYRLEGYEVYSEASLGIALGGPESDRPEDLLQDADTAMYRAKARGKAQFLVFDASMRAESVARMQLETDLRRGLDRREFLLHYQPILDLADGRITGFEALLRWRHPRRGLIFPADFIPIAEETGLIIPIGLWVLGEACRQMSSWQWRFPARPARFVSVNLSGKQIMQGGLVAQVRRILRETGLSPAALKLEVTETSMIEEPQAAIAVLNEFRELGVRIGLDDFGAGYSSFGQLQRFPIETLKIDRSFIGPIDTDPTNVEIVRAIVALARNLNMLVVAEGVETAHQRAKLRSVGCEFAQGHLFSRPVDAEAASRLLEAGPRSFPD